MTQPEGAEPPVPGPVGSTAPPGAQPTRGLDDYALACQRVGQPVLQCDGTWWREVRPCFFRPILPFLDVRSGPVGLPYRAAVGGYRYAPGAGGVPPNSHLVFLAYEDPSRYSVDDLAPRLRRYVRSAEKCFAIRPLTDSDECKVRAHPVYLEFHDRTKYGYLPYRTHRPRFEHWVDAEFADPGLVALGAWKGDSLVAVSMSRVVGEAWVYSSFFASNEALHGHVANLMLHHVRCLASAVDGVRFVFAGMQKLRAGASVDEFHLRRGATLLRKPAVLHVSGIARWVLSRMRPDVWDGLRGGSGAGSGIQRAMQ